jgi:hypothetical protein
VLHIRRHGEKSVDAGDAVKCQFDDRISLDGDFEWCVRQNRVVLHVTRQCVQHVGMVLDQRPMNVAEMIEELRARHGRIAPAGDHHLQHVPTPLVSCAFLFEHDLLENRHPLFRIVL